MKFSFRPAAVLVAGLMLLAACQPSASASPAWSRSAGSRAATSCRRHPDLRVIDRSAHQRPRVRGVRRCASKCHRIRGWSGYRRWDGLFCADEIDIADASRARSRGRNSRLRDAGVEWVELKIGIDGMAVITSSLTTTSTA